MRLLLGLVLGAVLTVGGAYVYDSHNAVAAGKAPPPSNGLWSTGMSSPPNGNLSPSAPAPNGTATSVSTPGSKIGAGHRLELLHPGAQFDLMVQALRGCCKTCR